MGYKINQSQMIVITLSLFLFGLLMLGVLNLYSGLNLQNPQIEGQEDDDFKTIDSANTLASNSSNISGVKSEDIGNQFTISCSDFKKLFDALVALNIGNEAAEGRINQSTLEKVENIFNIYAGNCSQLDEYEFD
ncbi:MAG TPA: hypothetical protein VHH33_02745 [Nitrososphaeraceae archaeon]|nr:hypothetical protein [Nitrososphaeraceae archaeon]